MPSFRQSQSSQGSAAAWEHSKSRMWEGGGSEGVLCVCALRILIQFNAPSSATFATQPVLERSQRGIATIEADNIAAPLLSAAQNRREWEQEWRREWEELRRKPNKALAKGEGVGGIKFPPHGGSSVFYWKSFILAANTGPSGANVSTVHE